MLTRTFPNWVKCLMGFQTNAYFKRFTSTTTRWSDSNALQCSLNPFVRWLKPNTNVLIPFFKRNFPASFVHHWFECTERYQRMFSYIKMNVFQLQFLHFGVTFAHTPRTNTPTLHNFIHTTAETVTSMRFIYGLKIVLFSLFWPLFSVWTFVGLIWFFSWMLLGCLFSCIKYTIRAVFNSARI